MSVKLKSAGACVHASTGAQLPAKGEDFEVADEVAKELLAAGLATAGKSKGPASPEKE